MQKPLLQDVVRKEVRKVRPSINDDALPEASVPERGSLHQDERAPAAVSVPPRRQSIKEPPPPHFISKQRSRPEGGGGSKLVILGIVGIVALLGLGIVASMLFSGATITVYPKQQKNVFIDGTFIAKAEPLPGELGYSAMTIEREASRVISGSGSEMVEEFASGQIEILNNYSTEDYPLIKRTRFEAPDGRIYRIQEAVTVPGQTASGAGSVVVTVYADEPGERFNLEDATFTVPGFEGMPQFDGFSARTISAISGGFAGSRAIVSEADEAAARQALQESLLEELRTAAFSSSEKPDNFYLYEDALVFNFESLPTTPEGDDQAVVTEKGTVTAILFEKDKFARHLAANTIVGYEDEPIQLENAENLSLSIEELSNSDLPWDGMTYRIIMTGTADFTWKFDPERLREDLAGRDDKALPTILSGYPSIDRAEASLRPFWKQAFPEDPSEITVTQVLD